MTYSVEYTKKATRQLGKLDKPVSARIYDWIDTHLIGCDNPRHYGDPLTGDHHGQWRYRVGDYRIIAEIHDDKVLMMVVTVGHRREVYGL